MIARMWRGWVRTEQANAYVALWRPKTWGVYKTYKSFKPFTRKLIWLSVITGIIILIWCSQIDLGGSKWWHSHAYIPNVWAGFTGFLIGAPVGLVILATFTTEREQNATLARVNSMSELGWQNFIAAFHAFYTAERYEAVTITAAHAKTRHDESLDVVKTFIAFIRIGRPSYERDENDKRTITDFHRAIQASYEPFREAVEPITHAIKDHETIETQWSAVVGAWQILNQFIRLQRLEQTLDWFFPADPEVDAEMRKWLSHNPNPLTVFANAHGYAATSQYSPSTMVNALNAVKTYSALSEEELKARLSATTDYFGYSAVAHYESRAREASFFLERLAHCVARIHNANWPASARTRRRHTET
jgi:hypothetical protein